MIKKDIYLEIKKKFGKSSSWTIWDKPENGNWKSKSNIGGLQCFCNEEELVKKLNPNYIFVGYNPANHNDRGEEIKTWSNFHSDNKRKSQDYKLRYALKDTKYLGSFITDVYPKIVETDSTKVGSKVSKDMTNESINDLIYVRKILGNKATIIAIGDDSFNVLKNNLPIDIKLVKIMHYSYQFINQENYRTKVLEQLANQIQK